MEKQVRTDQCHSKRSWLVSRIARGIALGLVFVLVFGIIVNLLWNWVMPAVFGLRQITYGQAVGMIILARILLGLGGRGMRPGMARAWGGRGTWGSSGLCSRDIANGHISDWRLYDAWWDAEGRQAFRNYIDSMKNERNTL